LAVVRNLAGALWPLYCPEIGVREAERKLENGRKSNMKFCKVSLFFALLVALCLPVVGQTAMRVNIPFNFVAGGKSLPAGRYMVAPEFSQDLTAWSISNDHLAAMLITNQADSTQQAHRSSLVFLQAGGTYSLVQIWDGKGLGRDTLRSKVKQTLVSKDESNGNKYIEIGAE
jgi:hypothetical protein